MEGSGEKDGGKGWRVGGGEDANKEMRRENTGYHRVKTSLYKSASLLLTSNLIVVPWGTCC